MTDERLFQVQRHERLLTELHRLGAVRVRELARDLGVSELTIRRDIAALAARNLVNRVHGGATLPSRSRPAGRPRAATTTGFAIGMVVPSPRSAVLSMRRLSIAGCSSVSNRRMLIS